MMLVAGLSLGSCVKSTLDPLSGDYLPAPTVVTLTKLDKSDAFKDDAGRWTFELDLSSAEGTKLHAVLIGNKYFLGSNTYSAATDATAKNGNFVAEKTTVNGKASKSGDFTVRQDGQDYSLSAVLFLTDGSPYKLEWEGTLVYEEPVVLDPEYTYSDVIAQDCTLEDGSTPVTDVDSHTLTLKDKNGEFAAQIKLIRAAGTPTDKLAGQYTVKEYAHEDFSAGNGFDLGVYFGMAAGDYVIGSYYVQDGTAVIIEPGETIDVTDMGNGIYSISGAGFSFLCAPEGFTPGSVVYDMTDTVAQDCTLEDGQTPVTDVESHTFVMKDADGNFVAQIKLIRSLGVTDFAGEYTVKEYAHEDFAAGNGFDLGVYFGMDPGAYVIGSYYVQDGAVVIIEPGATITVSSAGENTWKFVGDDFEFTGKLAGETPGPGPEPQEGIKIDGDPSDWVGVANVVSLECPAGAELSGIQSAKLLYSDKLYFLVELSDAAIADGKVRLHVYFDTDDFGCQAARWIDNSIDYMLEGKMTSGGEFVAYSSSFYKFTGTQPTDWSGCWDATDFAPVFESAGAGNCYELSMEYGGYPGGLPEQFNIGLDMVDSNWATFGFVPQTSHMLAIKKDGIATQPAEPGEDTFDYTPSAAYNASANLWKAADAAGVEFFYYLNPNWAGEVYNNVASTECPYAEFKQSTYKLTQEYATSSRWENQFYIHPYGEGNWIALDAAKTYKFSVTLQSTASFGAFFKLSKYNPDGGPKYEGEAIWEPEGYPDNVVFEAGKPLVFEHEFTGVEAPNVNLIFDFGGASEGAVVYIKDIILSEVGGEPGPGDDAVELSEFLSLTDYSIYSMPMVGMELGTPGFYYQAPDWQTVFTATYPVDGNFLKLEVYSADGKVAPGTYVPSAVNGTVNPGEFNLGAESWGGAGGTSWYTVAGGAATFDLITDGTVEISQDGDVYTIEVKTSAVNAKYVGKLSK